MKRRVLLDIGMFLASLVVEWVRLGHLREAQAVERRLLNPIQRRLGVPMSDYAARKL